MLEIKSYECRILAYDLILAGFGIRQSNPYTIAKILHFCSLSDCYWMKEKDEALTWKSVSLFHNRFEDAVTATSLLGVNGSYAKTNARIHTPELINEYDDVKVNAGEAV